jgi:uncharacterized protein YjcR
MVETVDAVVDALGGTGKVAEKRGLTPSTVSSWKARKSIPAEHWLGLVEMAQAEGVEAETLESLAALHAKPVSEARA